MSWEGSGLFFLDNEFRPLRGRSVSPNQSQSPEAVVVADLTQNVVEDSDASADETSTLINDVYGVEDSPYSYTQVVNSTLPYQEGEETRRIDSNDHLNTTLRISDLISSNVEEMFRHHIGRLTQQPDDSHVHTLFPRRRSQQSGAESTDSRIPGLVERRDSQERHESSTSSPNRNDINDSSSDSSYRNESDESDSDDSTDSSMPPLLNREDISDYESSGSDFYVLPRVMRGDRGNNDDNRRTFAGEVDFEGLLRPSGNFRTELLERFFSHLTGIEDPYIHIAGGWSGGRGLYEAETESDDGLSLDDMEDEESIEEEQLRVRKLPLEVGPQNASICSAEDECRKPAAVEILPLVDDEESDREVCSCCGCSDCPGNEEDDDCEYEEDEGEESEEDEDEDSEEDEDSDEDEDSEEEEDEDGDEEEEFDNMALTYALLQAFGNPMQSESDSDNDSRHHMIPDTYYGYMYDEDVDEDDENDDEEENDIDGSEGDGGDDDDESSDKDDDSMPSLHDSDSLPSLNSESGEVDSNNNDNISRSDDHSANSDADSDQEPLDITNVDTQDPTANSISRHANQNADNPIANSGRMPFFSFSIPQDPIDDDDTPLLLPRVFR